MSLNVKHYLGVYKIRMEMQDSGITNPTDEMKKLTKTIVEKLSLLPLDENIKLEDGKMIDSKGNIIITIPRNLNE